MEADLPADPNYWKNLVHSLEVKSQRRTKKKTIHFYENTGAIPDSLQKRVAKLLTLQLNDDDDSSLPPDRHSPFDMDEESEDLRSDIKAKKDAVYNESTCSEIERLENEFHMFDLKLAKPMKRKDRKSSDENWWTSYLYKARRERVKWGTKIYKTEFSMAEKSLDEQAEELMDASAERFTDWLNALGSNNVYNISKEKLKSLFSIEGDKSLFASIMTDPKEVHAIAKAVADKWNLPQMAIELKYENYLKNRLRDVPKRVIKVAFGRTVPLKDRPWLPSKNDKPISTVFPDDLLSMTVLFKGIRHLRTTRALVEFLINHPKFEKPRYLVNEGMFTAKTRMSIKQDVPLYELLKLKY